jgi:CubicO group peptidase (beta-lactamase class C family)
MPILPGLRQVFKVILFLVAAGAAVVLLLYLVKTIRFRLLKDPAAALAKETAPAPEGDSDDTQNLNGLLEAIRVRYKLPALAAAVVQGVQTTGLGAVGIRRYGHAARVGPDDRFHIGSCTKSMTATLCAVLVEQGKLRWDTTIAESFPELADKIRAEYRLVTLEQILNHRSGLPDDREPDAVLWPKITSLTGPLKEQRHALVEIVLRQPPTAAPGAKQQYSNDGYAIAGAMCEQATGQPWEDLMRKLLFEPLGMTTAGFGAPGQVEKVDAPWGHLLDGLTWQPIPPGPDADNPGVIGPAGNVHCSLEDWARFARLHLQGERGEAGLLKAETFRKLHTPPFGDDYAFGWLVADRDWAGGKALTHGGSNGYWFAVIWLAPNRNSGYLAVTNLGNETAEEACDSTVGELIETVK